MARLPSVPDLTLGKPGSFAECQLPDTRQTWLLCRVSTSRHSANLAPLPSVNSGTLGKPAFFVECQISDTRQRLAQNVQMLASLPSVTAQTLGKEAILVPECIGRWGMILAIASPATNEHNRVNCKFRQHLPCTVI